VTITQPDLEKELSQNELLQLTDINGTGVLDTEVLNDAIEDALAFIESFFTLPQTPTPLLKKIGVDLAVYELRKKNSLVDEEMKSERKENEAYLMKMAKNLIPIATSGGVTPAPKTSGSSFVHGRTHTDTSGLRMP